jgi:tetratricopeptide (TPR) repeat protein
MITVGKEAFNKQDYETAERCLKDVIKKKAVFPDLYNMLGLIYHERGKYGLAHKAFEKALELNPNYTEASLNLSVTYNDLGKYTEAKAVYTKAKKASTLEPGEIDPYLKGKLANLHFELGEIYRGINLYDDAINEFKKALFIRPTFVDIKTRLADTYREQGNIDKAIKEYIDAKKLGKNYSAISINLGISYYAQGKYQKARGEWEEVVMKDPNNKRAPMYLSLLDLAEKKPALVTSDLTHKRIVSKVAYHESAAQKHKKLASSKSSHKKVPGHKGYSAKRKPTKH